MRPHSPILVFLGRLALVYVLIIIPWPGFTEIYASYFRALGETFYAQYSEHKEVSFEMPPADSPHPRDTRVVIVNHALMNADGSGPIRTLDFDARIFGWRPMALLLALIVATPLSWQRRRRALVFGGLCIHAVIVAVLGISIYTESAQISLVTLTPFWMSVVYGLKTTLVSQLSFVMPILVWAAVTFRREDRLGMLGVFAFGNRKRVG